MKRNPFPFIRAAWSHSRWLRTKPGTERSVVAARKAARFRRLYIDHLTTVAKEESNPELLARDAYRVALNLQILARLEANFDRHRAQATLVEAEAALGRIQDLAERYTEVQSYCSAQAQMLNDLRRDIRKLKEGLN